jgi:hypothetical protein
MPPHCDSIDGPVVKAAIRALDERNVNLILPFVHEAGEEEVRRAFEQALEARAIPQAREIPDRWFFEQALEARAIPQAREIADRWFFETVVRVHRAGEGAPYTGLKPAGLDVGPVIPAAERAIENGSPDALLQVLGDILHEEVKRRLDRVMELQAHQETVAKAREYVEAMLGLEAWAHKLYVAMHAAAHETGGGEDHH